MLSYEDELSLSDKLVTRRPLVEAQKSGQDLSQEELDIVQEGDEAAKAIVEAYIPFVRSISSVLFYNNRLQNSLIEFDDLVNEGVKAAISCTNAFNARGAGEFSGKRFSGYSELMIRKSIKRFIAKESTPLKLSVDAIQTSYRWFAIRAELTTKLGRVPTNKEMSAEAPDIDIENVFDIPKRGSMVNLDDPERADIEQSSLGSSTLVDNDYYVTVLRLALDEVLHPIYVDTVILYFGCDRGYPRTANELAKDMKITLRDAKVNASKVQDIIIHPQYRVLIARAIAAQIASRQN